MSIEALPRYGDEVAEVHGTVPVKGGEGEAALAGFKVPPGEIHTNISSIFWHFDDSLRAKGLNVHRFTLPDGFVNSVSQVMVSICELDPNGRPKVGSAPMSILNVAPLNNGAVDVAYRVDWNDLLPLRFNFIIVN